jgi:hypothetical protein
MNHRPLKTIAAEIATALKREVTNVIEIGGLLAEAQEQLGARGRWLPWLRDNFPLTPRTAQNYMAASAFAREYETVSHSRLTIRGLYALVDANRDGNVQAVGAALAEAKTKSVDDDRVRRSLQSCRRRLERAMRLSRLVKMMTMMRVKTTMMIGHSLSRRFG